MTMVKAGAVALLLNRLSKLVKKKKANSRNVTSLVPHLVKKVATTSREAPTSNLGKNVPRPKVVSPLATT